MWLFCVVDLVVGLLRLGVGVGEGVGFGEGEGLGDGDGLGEGDGFGVGLVV